VTLTERRLCRHLVAMHTRTRYAPADAGATALITSAFDLRAASRGTRPFVSARTVRPRTSATRAVVAFALVLALLRTVYATRSRSPGCTWRTGFLTALTLTRASAAGAEQARTTTATHTPRSTTQP
jgi:hypothetical protein